LRWHARLLLLADGKESLVGLARDHPPCGQRGCGPDRRSEEEVWISMVALVP
jgi:hypothetical protein